MIILFRNLLNLRLLKLRIMLILQQLLMKVINYGLRLCWHFLFQLVRIWLFHLFLKFQAFLSPHVLLLLQQKAQLVHFVVLLLVLLVYFLEQLNLVVVLSRHHVVMLSDLLLQQLDFFLLLNCGIIVQLKLFLEVVVHALPVALNKVQLPT